jgi:thioredoxin reductase (NADPH)
MKDFLARNQIPYQGLDIELSEEAKKLAAFANCDRLCLPLVLFADGGSLIQPSIADVAEKIGLKTQAEKPFYDLIIVGGGPAGLAAAVYGASEGLRTVMIEREAPGGQAGTIALRKYIRTTLESGIYTISHALKFLKPLFHPIL